MPLRFKNGTEAKVKISCARQRESRTRAKGEGALDVPASALGILGGLMTAALTPVGHFSVTRRGGDVANPFSLPFEMPSGSADGRTTYERLWSPTGVPPADVVVVRRSEVGRVLTATGYVLAAIGGPLPAVGLALVLQLVLRSAPLAGTTLTGATLTAVGVVLVASFYVSWIVVGILLAQMFLRHELPIVTRPRASYLGDAVGPGVRLTVGPK
jgi:hypothetical protein